MFPSVFSHQLHSNSVTRRMTSASTKSETKYVKTILGQFVKLGHGHFQFKCWIKCPMQESLAEQTERKMNSCHYHAQSKTF